MTRMTDVVLPPTFETTARAGSAVWHASLPIQINWTYEIDGCDAKIFCPGNAYPWVMARIQGPTPNQTEAYARLIAAAPDLFNELSRLYRAYVNLLEIGRDRIVSLGGDCDPVDRMEADDPALVAARLAITKAQGQPSVSGGEESQ